MSSERPLKGRLDSDPRGLIFEAYRIEGISEAECRTIFLDWVLGVPAWMDIEDCLRDLHAEYSPSNVDHPMTRILEEGMQQSVPVRRRNRRRARSTRWPNAQT
ncbi:MAG: hypothetical protein OXI81_03360 [Paracoccaceae bacterium]|nr:hypothetical protein [Paracoccaceae bacterium]MDE2914976.1 hypothetical protein [Paracoccaceae bacterium]